MTKNKFQWSGKILILKNYDGITMEYSYQVLSLTKNKFLIKSQRRSFKYFQFFHIYIIKMIQNWNNTSYNCWYYPYFDYQNSFSHSYYPAMTFRNSCQPALKKEENLPLENPSQKGQKQPEDSTIGNKLNEKEEKKEKLENIKIKGRRMEGDQDYQERRQTPQRNTLSNTIKYFLRYVLLKPLDAGIQIRKISSYLEMDYETDQFLNSFQKQFQSKMNYISKDSVECIWLQRDNCLSHICGNQKRNFCLIFRKLFIHYFDEIIFGERLNDKKKRKKYEISQKKYIRSFIRQLENRYRKYIEKRKD